MPDVLPILSPQDLELQILNSLRASGRTVLLLPSTHPKPLRVVLGGLGDEAPTLLRIYGWNVTHGGGTARAKDEYRIQLTGVMPEIVPGETTVVLGWSTTFNTFAGWDASVHSQRKSHSPSLQIREATLESASESGLTAALRDSDDVVVAFRAELLATYCLNAEEIHSDTAADIVKLLNEIPTASQTEAPNLETKQVTEARKKVARVVESNFRAWDFGKRVQKAYKNRCAVCGIQLALTEAAHIVPVAWEGSTDLTSNGMSLCRNHHRAYDANLISVTPNCLIEVSKSRGKALVSASLSEGYEELSKFDGQPLALLPDELSDQPKASFLQMGRIARRWVS